MKQYVVKDGKCSVTEMGGGMVVCIPRKYLPVIKCVVIDR